MGFRHYAIWAPKIKTSGGGFLFRIVFHFVNRVPEETLYSVFLAFFSLLHLLVRSHSFYLMTKILVNHFHPFVHSFIHSLNKNVSGDERASDDLWTFDGRDSTSKVSLKSSS